MRIGQGLGFGILAACSLVCSICWAQTPDKVRAIKPIAPIERPDAQRTRMELAGMLQRYPPSLRVVLSADPSLLGNESYLAPYSALVNFLDMHPEVARNPSFYIEPPGTRPSRGSPAVDLWRDVLTGLAVFTGFGMGIGLLVWLIRTLVDYRRWNRLTRTQAEFHTKLMDRFTASNDLLAYIESPAGSKFLQSAPIALDAAPRSMGAPLGRILWSVQGGVVLVAAGIGLWIVSERVANDASEPLHALAVIGFSLGLGFAVSAIISFVISHRLGLIESRTSGPLSGGPSGKQE